MSNQKPQSTTISDELLGAFDECAEIIQQLPVALYEAEWNGEIPIAPADGIDGPKHPEGSH